ncbi:MAG: U32 family peptidase [Lachnospiraceae bacterium]|nr:U32 family peptidase [Lachnospiraceae bacterium]
MNIRVLVSNERQLNAAIRSGCSSVALESAGFPFEDLVSAARRVKEASKTCYYAFPQVFRFEAEKIYAGHVNDLKNAGFDGFIVRSYEVLAFLSENDLGGERIADHNLYVWNREALSYMLSHGFDRVTAPVELTARELSDVGFAGQEIVAYGRLPMMVTANCLFQTTDRCDRKGTEGILTDRLGHRMVVTRDCRTCQNTILNALPLSLLREGKTISALGFDSARLIFTDESESETASVIERFSEAFLNEKEVTEPEDRLYTRGHFRNMIE